MGELRLLDDDRLNEVALELAKTGWAAAILDADLHLRWVSDELKALLGETDETKLGYGRHIVEVWWSGTWADAVTDESRFESWQKVAPWIVNTTPEGLDAIERMAPGLADLTGEVEPASPPLLYTLALDYKQGDLSPVRVIQVGARLHDSSGELLGTVHMFSSALPATVLHLVARGDEGMFGRMARLVEPGRRQAAILFADLQMSGMLSRRLPSAAYFKLIRAITTGIDDVIIGHTGIVGKHAGDGVTAFFLAEDLGSSSAAARSAIEAARAMSVAARDAAKGVMETTDLLAPEECLINVGVHWGGSLYMGQLVTGGRLEVTALGDRVNECARLQQSARDGQILASKTLVEHLTEADAASVGIDPDALMYRTLSEFPGADAKALREAGSLPATVL
ncbi:MAG TPA: adenylate/guanylate cyclase domain-containing protein [Actinomycetota bacterium]|jgi:class 3 adenylate cyclase|nr:adenylate/guanylate cyclase domain-containing protein [Actinomycetota bacterium]